MFADGRVMTRQDVTEEVIVSVPSLGMLVEYLAGQQWPEAQATALNAGMTAFPHAALYDIGAPSIEHHIQPVRLAWRANAVGVGL